MKLAQNTMKLRYVAVLSFVLDDPLLRRMPYREEYTKDSYRICHELPPTWWQKVSTCSWKYSHKLFKRLELLKVISLMKDIPNKLLNHK